MPTPPILPDLTLLRRIGGGSYGDVWIARTLTGIYRAVKIVDRARFPDERPFLRELDGITRFQQSVGDQPRQLALLHVGRLEPDGILYYTMELADDLEAGTEIDPELYVPLTLKALHEKRPIVPAAECVRIGTDLARALSGLHEAGLIHRDLKPSNIIFVAGVPKLADIGLVSSSDHTLTSLGTPGYSPPEGAGTERADIYSLGKVLYGLATGMPTRDFPRLPSDIETRSDAPLLLELNEVILRACEADPQQRYATAQAMLDDLLLLQAGKSVKELNEARRRVRALLRVGAVAGAIALGVIGVLGVKNYFAARALATQEAAARQRAEADERLARYTADLHLAQLSLASGDLGLARAALRRQIPKSGEPDLRGLEWRALWNESAGDDTRVLGAISGPAVRALALSPDGKFLAAQEGENTNRTTVLWDTTTGQRRVLAPSTRSLGGFSTDGTQLIVGTQDRRVHLVDLASGNFGPAQDGASGVILAHAGDGRTVALVSLDGNRTRVQLWDALAVREVGAWLSEQTFAPAAPTAVAVSRDLGLLAVALFHTEGQNVERQLQLWDLRSSTLITRKTDTGTLMALQFSPDGKRLAVGGAGRPISIIDTSDGRVLAELTGHSGQVFDLEFSNDGRALVSAGEDQTLRVWDLERGTTRAVLRGHEGGLNAALVRADDSQFVTASDDGTVREWRLPTTRWANARGGFWPQTLGDLAFAPDSTAIFATTADGRLGRLNALTLDAEGNTWDAFRPLGMNGATLFAVNRDGELESIDTASGTVSLLGLRPDPGNRVITLGGSRDGRFAGLGLADGTMEFWDCSTARALPRDKKRNDHIWTIAFSSDGKIAASGDRTGHIWIWDPATGRALRELPARPSEVTQLVFVPGGSRFVVGCEDGSLAVANAETGIEEPPWRGHTRSVSAGAVSSDGSRLVTGGYDGLVIIWSLADKRQLAVFSLGDGTTSHSDRRARRIRIAPDGSQVAVLVEDGTLRRWDLR